MPARTRRRIRYANYHAPFFLFKNEVQARAFLEEAQDRFAPSVALALWRGTAAEIWECPIHVYSGYKRNRWPSYWRAYARLRGTGSHAPHPDECISVVRGVEGLPA